MRDVVDSAAMLTVLCNSCLLSMDVPIQAARIVHRIGKDELLGNTLQRLTGKS